MILPDVNVLVYAHRPDAENHIAYRTWLEHLLAGDRAYGLSDFVLSGFLRIVTNRRIFLDPSPIEKALAFAEEIRTRRSACRSARGQGTGTSSNDCAWSVPQRETWCPMPSLPRLPSSRAVSGSPPTGTTPASPPFAGAIRSAEATAPSSSNAPSVAGTRCAARAISAAGICREGIDGSTPATYADDRSNRRSILAEAEHRPDAENHVLGGLGRGPFAEGRERRR